MLRITIIREKYKAMQRYYLTTVRMGVSKREDKFVAN